MQILGLLCWEMRTGPVYTGPEMTRKSLVETTRSARVATPALLGGASPSTSPTHRCLAEDSEATGSATGH